MRRGGHVAHRAGTGGNRRVLKNSLSGSNYRHGIREWTAQVSGWGVTAGIIDTFTCLQPGDGVKRLAVRFVGGESDCGCRRIRHSDVDECGVTVITNRSFELDRLADGCAWVYTRLGDRDMRCHDS